MQTISKLIRQNWQVLLLILIFLVVRLPRFETNFKFEMEHADDFRAFQTIWNKLKSSNYDGLLYRGQEATFKITPESVNVPVYHGVFYYYFLTPFAALGNFEPVKLLYFRLLLDLISVILLFKVSEKIFSSKTAALLSGVIYIGFFWTGVYARYIWTPSLMPVFMLVSLYGYIFRERNWLNWLLLGLGAGAASQVQVTGYWIIIFFGLLLLIDRVKLSWGRMVVMTFGLLLPTWPSIIHEINSNFELVKYIFSAIATSEVSSPIQFLSKNSFELYTKIMGGLVFGSAYHDKIEIFKWLRAAAVIAVFSAGAIATIKTRTYTTKMIPLSIWLSLPLPWLMANYYLYSQPMSYDRLGYVITPFINNLNYLLPLLAILLTWLSVKISKQSKVIQIASLMLLCWIVATNFHTMARNLYNPSSLDYNAGDKIQIVKILGEDLGNSNYELNVTQTVGRNDEWAYLAQVYAPNPPEKYNGKINIGHKSFPVTLQGNEAINFYQVVDRRYEHDKSDEVNWVLLGKASIYELWKKVDE